MIITNGKQNDKRAIRKLWDECFDEDSIEWRDWYFDNIFSIDNIIGAKHNGELLSMIHMNPYSIFMRVGKINAFALAGVATQASHRGQGYAGNLIKYALNKAYKLGFDFSFLYPFKYEFYKKFGYSIGYSKFKNNYKYFPENDGLDIIIHDKFDDSTFVRIYNKHMQKRNGYVLRDEFYYQVHLKELLCDNNRVICFSINNKLGYFCINEERTRVEELVYTGNIEEAINAIGFYYKKDITFENIYDSDYMLNIEEPHCMGRVISVERIFEKIQCKDINVNIKIEDLIIKENNAVWNISLSNGKTKIEKTDNRADFKINISQLTPILTGYKIEKDEVAKRIQSLLFENTQEFIFEIC